MRALQLFPAFDRDRGSVGVFVWPLARGCGVSFKPAELSAAEKA